MKLSAHYECQYRDFAEKGRRALAQSNLTEAVEALGRAALFRSNDPEAYLNLGRALCRAGKIEAARQSFIHALNISPQSPDVRSALLALPPLAPSRPDFEINKLLHVPDLQLGFWVCEVRKGGFGAVYIVDEWPSGLPPIFQDGEDWLDNLFDGRDRSALKTFQARFLWSDEDRKRFEREALHWTMLERHPNIVEAKGFIVVQGFPCIWLEYLPFSLAELLAVNPLPVRLALELSLQFCDGMSYAHEKLGLVHRDIKPSNCLLTADKRTLKITDWGLSRIFSDAGEKSLELSGLSFETQAQLTTVAGTPQYMAPEQFLVGASLDTRTDIYSFAVMLYQMLSGDLPPIGYLAHSHIAQSEMSLGIPDNLRDLILRCVQPNPEQRFKDFRELRAGLESAYRDLIGLSIPPEAVPVQMTVGDWNDKGLSFSKLGHSEEACVCYQRAVEISPNHATVWLNYGAELAKLGRIDEGLACLEQGLLIDPNEPGLWKNKGIILESQGFPLEARVCFDRTISLMSDGLPYYQLREMVKTLSDSGDFESALRCCEVALNINGSDSALWSQKAIILSRLGRYDEVLGSCQEGLAIEPRNHKLWCAQAFALLNLARFKEALIACDRGLEVDASDAALWENKGATLQGLQQPELATKCFERARALRAKSTST